MSKELYKFYRIYINEKTLELFINKKKLFSKKAIMVTYMKRHLFILILFLFLRVIYSQSYVNCNINMPNSCLIGIYKINNTHATLCNQVAPFYIGCSIVNGQYVIAVNFSSDNCQNRAAMYLYNILNSHVGYTLNYRSDIYPGVYPVCLGNYFAEILNVTTDPQNSYYLVGLYKINNSHVTLDQDAPIRLYLKILDTQNPVTGINYTDRHITPPITIKINFSDNKYLYYCHLYINGKLSDFSNFCRFSNFYERDLVISANDCPPGQCNLTIVAVDLAGNINISENIYHSISPCLLIDAYPLVWDSIIISDFLPYNLKIKISNPITCNGNFTNIKISFPDVACGGLILVDGLQKRTTEISKLNNGEYYEVTTKIYPLRSGRCNFVITAEGYLDGSNIKLTYKKEIPMSVVIKTSIGLVVVAESFYSILIAIVLISLVLFL